MTNSIAELVNKAKEAELETLVYAHCDHFEPFGVKRKDAEGNMDLIGLEHVRTWAERCRKNYHMAKATPFILSRYLLERWSPTHPDNIVRADEFMGFASWACSKEDKDIIQLLHKLGFETQLHVHHENWTESKRSGLGHDPERDANRLKVYVQTTLDYLRDVTGEAYNEWFFVHGHWGLNASDTSVCNIVNEIEVLKSLGCQGDFTFTAGRKWCNPEINVPHAINPCTGEKSYASEEANPLILSENAKVLTPDRFLIWASPIHYFYLSLENIVKRGFGVYDVVDKWLNAASIGNFGFVKTHAHSMNPVFWSGEKETTTPMLSPNVLSALDLLAEVCEQAGINYLPASVPELYQILKKLDGETV